MSGKTDTTYQAISAVLDHDNEEEEKTKAIHEIDATDKESKKFRGSDDGKPKPVYFITIFVDNTTNTPDSNSSGDMKRLRLSTDNGRNIPMLKGRKGRLLCESEKDLPKWIKITNNDNLLIKEINFEWNNYEKTITNIITE
eukprot:90362_1